MPGPYRGRSSRRDRATGEAPRADMGGAAAPSPVTCRPATAGRHRRRHPGEPTHVHPVRRRLQGRRPLPRRVGPQGDRAGRGRDARPHGAARRVRRRAAAGRRPHHGLAAHDHPDGRADRDAHRARRRRALGVAATSSRPRTSAAAAVVVGPNGTVDAPAGVPGLRLEGRDARGVLVVHRAGPALARRWRPEHDPRRRRRRHAARPQGRRVREGRRGPRGHRRRPRRVARHHRHCCKLDDRRGPRPLDRRWPPASRA